jgi:hypothetical protein
MDLAVILPLAALLALQSFIALLLSAAPSAIAGAVAAALSKSKIQPGTNAAILTAAAAVAVVGASAGLQLAQALSGSSAGRLGNRAALALDIEELRAALAASLGLCNVVLLLTVRALSDAAVGRDKALLNLEVLRKQAAGVSAAYMAASASAAPKAAAAAAAEGDGNNNKNMAQVEALQAQAKGLEREYDRLLAEHDALKRRLAQADPAFAEREGLPSSGAARGGGGGAGGVKKKEF